MTAVDVSQSGQATDPASVRVLDLTGAAPPPTSSPRVSGAASTRAAAIVVPAIIGILAVWFILFAFVLSGFQERAGQARLYDAYRLELAQETAPLAEPVKTGVPVAMINAPAAGMHNLVVVEGTTSRLLEEGPGHLSDSPLPGQMGDSVILGRSVSYDGPFGRLSGVKPGDRMTVTDGQGVFEYRVEDVRHPGSPLPPALQSQQSRLTLVTSTSDGWRSGWAPAHTLYVDALLDKGKAQPVPVGLPATASTASLPMKTDPSGLVSLIFWLQGVAVAAALLVWSWARWGRPQTWIVGVPILLVVLWGASDALMRFLPNLL
jgi:sortase A